MRRHASIRLEERYGKEKADSLLKRLEQEIANGNFTAETTSSDMTSRGTINLEGEVFEVVIDNKTSDIITALPKGSLNEDRTRKYQGRISGHTDSRKYHSNN
jgi:hypothetical protein